MKRPILIIEDDVVYGEMLCNWFSKNGFQPTLCGSISSGKRELDRHKFDLILSDLRLPDGDGIGLLEWIRQQQLRTPVLMMTGYSEIQTAVLAIKLGAEDYLEKPINPALLKEKIESILRKDTFISSSPPKHTLHTPQIVFGKSVPAVLMYEYAAKVAPTRMSVLILGESGTGKEHLARMIHDQSERAASPFVAVDCGSLSKDLAPSELFGHLKGAFTSAIYDKKGVFEQAHGGTVFLDEIGNLSYDVQVQLLRAIQEQKVRQVGAAEDVSIDIRLISATNEDLPKAIVEGRFREDLYHRINEFSIRVPALRERIGDIPLYANHFMQQACEEFGKSPIHFSKQALQQIEAYPWSGNLRELRNTVRRAVLFAADTVIESINLDESISTTNETIALRKGDERQQIEAALERARGNKSLAAQLLKIDRKTLYNKMHQLGIEL